MLDCLYIKDDEYYSKLDDSFFADKSTYQDELDFLQMHGIDSKLQSPNTNTVNKGFNSKTNTWYIWNMTKFRSFKIGSIAEFGKYETGFLPKNKNEFIASIEYQAEKMMSSDYNESKISYDIMVLEDKVVLSMTCVDDRIPVDKQTLTEEYIFPKEYVGLGAKEAVTIDEAEQFADWVLLVL